MPVNALDGNAIEQLKQQLMQVFDRDHSGSLDGSEFANILKSLMGNHQLVNMETAQPGARAARLFDGPAAKLEGFDHHKMTTSTSPKYRFARVATQYGLSQVNNKNEAESLLQQMRPDLERAGVNILDVAGDRIKIRHEDRDVWVDVIRAASIGAEAFQWLPQE